ncbi:zinc-dependent alcohol dehydrogenase family protein [Ferruginibacter paludis]|uniref:zinc-dependent alcohol dehydrogenase family protein n=1 Tax=Ferruginibacter paludis TaxID=1310417 RepID=UPI0025B3F2C7|nr:zinc-dependent alcohol dehydrogenase family protein [Ferruginibacter paludis]MDN3656229.1 zinc-dependent alcohol dehydrogenase family protein [Ferruginibacter paludis]
MKAAYYESFKGPVAIVQLPDPSPAANEVIIRVKASGLCRSDWHGWQGHDSDIHLPHVPGHELAGIIVATGSAIRNWKTGDRVTVPFCVGCGTCVQCSNGQQQICDHYYQPGFTGWGSFAEFVRIPFADDNLVRLPDAMDFVTAAVLGCRFITAWRGVTTQGALKAGDFIAIHGCGGVGLSAIMIAATVGAVPIAVDIDDTKLAFAKSIGAAFAINARETVSVPDEILAFTKGGAHVSADALGSRQTCGNSIRCLRKQDKHIQLGLMAGSEANPPIPMGEVIARELQLIGSHGMQAHQYPGMLEWISSGKMQPEKLLGKIITLEESCLELTDLNSFRNTGVTVIQFD